MTSSTSTADRITSRFDRNATVFDVTEGVDLRGKTALVTGGGAGFGFATARALAKAGALVYVADIDISKTQEAVAAFLEKEPMAKLSALQLDLGSNTKVKAFAEAFRSQVPKLHILVNNAGIMAAPQAYTVDGIERQFAVNYLGHYVLTRLLEPSLVKAEGARTVSVSSIGHRRSDIRYEDINFRTSAYNTWEAYGQSKTACALLAVALDERLKNAGVRSNTLNPGGSLTGLHQHLTDDERRSMGWLDENGNIPSKWRTPEQCAATATWLAAAPELRNVGARYFEECQQAVPWSAENAAVGVKAYAVDPENAKRLWKASAEMTGLPD